MDQRSLLGRCAAPPPGRARRPIPRVGRTRLRPRPWGTRPGARPDRPSASGPRRWTRRGCAGRPRRSGACRPPCGNRPDPRPACRTAAAREHGQHPEDVRGREGDVQEKADARIGEALADHLGHEHQLVVVHPDQVAGSVVRNRGVGEAAVHLLVEIVVRDLERQLADEVVERRPEHAVAELLVVALDLVGAERDGDERELRGSSVPALLALPRSARRLARRPTRARGSRSRRVPRRAPWRGRPSCEQSGAPHCHGSP